MGLEFNSYALRAARDKGYKVSAISYQQAAIEMCNKYDLVCSFQVLEHLPDYISYFESSFKLLKDDGILVTSALPQDSIFGLANNVLNPPPPITSLGGRILH